MSWDRNLQFNAVFCVPSDVVVSLRIVSPSACGTMRPPNIKVKASVKNIGLDIVFFALLKGFTYLASWWCSVISRHTDHSWITISPVPNAVPLILISTGSPSCFSSIRNTCLPLGSVARLISMSCVQPQRWYRQEYSWAERCYWRALCRHQGRCHRQDHRI